MRQVYVVAMTKQDFKTLNHCVYSTNYHLVIVTKYRKKVINKTILDTLDRLIRERVIAWGGECMEVNGEPGHVHILMSLPPKACISDFVNALKTGTSRQIRNRFTDHIAKFYRKSVFWSKSYCVVSCGGAPLDVVWCRDKCGLFTFSLPTLQGVTKESRILQNTLGIYLVYRW